MTHHTNSETKSPKFSVLILTDHPERKSAYRHLQKSQFSYKSQHVLPQSHRSQWLLLAHKNQPASDDWRHPLQNIIVHCRRKKFLHDNSYIALPSLLWMPSETWSDFLWLTFGLSWGLFGPDTWHCLARSWARTVRWWVSIMINLNEREGEKVVKIGLQ